LSRLGQYDEAVGQLEISSQLAKQLKGRKDIEEALKNVDSTLKDARKKALGVSP
jgi:hypothetical protein